MAEDFDEDDDLDQEDEQVPEAKGEVPDEIDEEEEKPTAKAEPQPASEPELSEDEKTAEELQDAEDTAKDKASNSSKELPDEISAESQDLLDETPEQTQRAAPQPVSSPVASQLQKYQAFLDDYKKLQDQRRKGDLVTGLAAAGGQIGQAIAGRTSGQIIPDQSGIQLLNQLNNRPVQDLEEGQVVQGRQMQLQDQISANDANSPQSKLIRDYLNKRLGMNLAPDVSASDAMNLLKTVGRQQAAAHFQSKSGYYLDESGQKHDVTAVFDPSTGKYMNADSNQPIPNFHLAPLSQYSMQKDAHGNIVKVDKALGKITGTEASSSYKPVDQMTDKEITSFRPDKDQQKALHEQQNSLDKMTKAAQEEITSSNKLESVLNSDNKLQGTVLKTQLPRMSGFNGRMSPLEQGMWTGSPAALDRLTQYVQTLSDGTITPENKKQALELLNLYKQSTQQDLANIFSRGQNSLEQTYSIPKQFTSKALQVPSFINSKNPAGTTDMVDVVSAKTGASFKLPRNKVDDALKKKLIQPLSQ